MSSVPTDLEWIASWYASQVDGEWEHDFGVEIATLDNPGWRLRVDLERTALRDTAFASEEYEDGERWRRFWKDDENGAFNASGDPTALPEMVGRFRAWAQASSSPSSGHE